ncbi:uncharacterized protein UMAG_02668 [Mycosarcoma maydis]|uniref:Uncharacterized protein n=1 Tax=Mycosarcoma maydis TaxID=5270 RepID=A0A0D1C6W5_MYCMD|nr:uncharacterized protein UMAG_02668 [Ustilago maydis 521]KIS69327.1 hypothetical protein UMAG_02668 [Ustilago maydis 521]|eukprot:XP_011389053.1 hypothetical protein UMAG_02668 [Ustilago maydis 521]
MFAPMSKGGSDDAWQAQDEAGSLKPGRFRAYLADQLAPPDSASTSPASRPIPFPRGEGPSSSSSRRKNKASADKGKARDMDRGFMASFNQPEAAASTSLGKRLATGFGFRPSAAKPNKSIGTSRILRADGTPAPAFPARSIDSFYPASPHEANLPSRGIFVKRAQSSATALGPSPFQSPPPRRRRVTSIRDRNWERERERERLRPNRSWLNNLIRPPREIVEGWLDSWWKRWFALAGLPSLVVWIWCAAPFPKTDPYDPNLPWCNPGEDGRSGDPNNPPWCYPANMTSSTIQAAAATLTSPGTSTMNLPTVSGFVWFMTNMLLSNFAFTSTSSSGSQHPIGDGDRLTVDANFWFFLIFYYGIYVGVALIYITQLFGLYRLNWWPAALGAKTSYTFFWIGSLVAGYILHELDPLGTETRHRPNAGGSDVEREDGVSQFATLLTFPSAVKLQQWSNVVTANVLDSKPSIDDADIQWQRKTLWVGLAFATMAMPALVCFVGLRRSGRQMYRHSLTDHQKTFLERQLNRRIPSSYIRFLWFMSTIGLSLFALIAGQGYASVYLSTLPHTGLDGVAYVSFWTLTVNGLALVSHWILESKVRSRALVFAFKYYYFLVYFIFYRNLFARLRSFDQFALVQLLSSFWVCIWYPLSMSRLCHRIVQYFNPSPRSWEEYVESVGLAFYLRNLAQNTTMLAFLGWVSILHFGSNQSLYPFFAYDNKHDPYNYQLTMLGSVAIWGSELLSSFVARQICYWAFKVDVTNLGLDEMREFPELLTTIGWGSVHTLMDMLMFLIKLNFR